MEESKVKEVLGTEVIMQSLLGKLYDILTMGEDGTPKSEDNFFSWATPGIPVTVEDYTFMTQGLVGKSKPEKLKSVIAAMVEDVKKANEGCTNEELTAKLAAIDATEVMKELIVQDEHDMIQQAENFAHLVDFIPDVSGTGKDGLCTYEVMENEGTLSQVYEMVLRFSQVKDTKIDPEVQAVIDKYRQMMVKEVEKPTQDKQEETKEEKTDAAAGGSLLDLMNSMLNDSSSDKSSGDADVSDDGEGLPVPSDFARAYNIKAAAYENALLEYGNYLVDGLNSKEAGGALRASKNAEAYRNKLTRAMNDWVTLGHKNEYERMANFIEQIKDRSIAALKAQYKMDLKLSKLTGLSSGATFYYSTLSPASFATSMGWTKFSFSHKDIHKEKDTTTKKHYSELKTNVKAFPFVKFSSNNSKESNNYELNVNDHSEIANIEFEMCQVPIVRPWFNTSFLNSKFWRFEEGDNSTFKGTMLSDGNRPPKEGIMPAYPTAIIFIRNLKLTFNNASNIQKGISEYERTKASYGGGLNFGRWLNLSVGANYKSDDSKQHNHNEKDYTFSGQSITVPGMQIVGFKCHMLSKCPNPNPNIKDWI